ncbi:MAG: TolC family protein [Paludibacteraceae bacterium]|nr:TolC family protein [Paludibacteraceae bacterium]
MMKFRLLLLLALTVASVTAIQAQRKLTIEECQDLALQDNNSNKINNELVAAATDMRKSAFAAFFPKLSANGMYMWNQKNIALLRNQLETGMGTFNAANSSFTFNPESILPDIFPTTSSLLADFLGEEYTKLHDRLTLNIHNVFVGQVGVIQPIYVGGRLREVYNLSKGAEKIAKLKADKGKADVITDVNEAYWRVVAVQEKLKLATRYVDLLKQLESNVSNAIEEGVATKSDLLKVKMKLTDGEMKLAQAEDGLALSKMALCQIIGLDLDTDIELDASKLEQFSIVADTTEASPEAPFQRSEIKLLEEGEKMAKSVARLASAGLQPNILASANYVISNPSCFDGFNNKFDGMFNVGVVVNIPIAHVDAIYRYKSAKHIAKAAQLKLEESVEMIRLQITQSMQKVKQSNRKLKTAQINMEQADEVLRMAQDAYDEGMATSADLMMAETGWQQAYSEKIDAAIELRMNEITLQKHLGVLLQDKNK